MEKAKFYERLKEINSLLPDMSDGQLAEVAKTALCHMTGEQQTPDEVWSYFDWLTEADKDLNH